MDTRYNNERNGVTTNIQALASFYCQYTQTQTGDIERDRMCQRDIQDDW